MTNLIKVKVELTLNQTKYGDEFITTKVIVPTTVIENNTKKEITLQVEKKHQVKLDAFQLLCAYFPPKNINDKLTIRLKDVQAYLISGNEYKEFNLIRVRIVEGVSVAIFPSRNYMTLFNDFYKIPGSFLSKGEYELAPLELPTTY